MDTTAAVHPTDETLRSHSLGALDQASADSVNKHLEACADCRDRVAAMASDTALGRLREALGQPGSTGHRISSLDGLSMLDDGASQKPPPPAESLPPGLADHPDYEVIRELGQGGMGTVYLAKNRLMGRHEVLKVVSKRMMNRPSALERFLSEIRNAARLHHANIVTAYAATRVGESIVFAMEYVEGLDLSKLVKAKGPLPVTNACHYIHQASLGLQHACELGMVHRDIKPSNLMLAKQGDRAVIKVLDFGLAKVKSEGAVDEGLTHDGQLLGTPEYVAPEQISDARHADIRADVYSLGCTLYCLLTGAPPFQAACLYDLLQAHHSMDALPLNLARPAVPFELAALVAKMMAKEPERRFQTPKDVAEALLPFFKKGVAGITPAASAVGELSEPSEEKEGRAYSRTDAAPLRVTPQTPSLRIASAIETSSAIHPAEPAWDGLIKFREVEPPKEALPVRTTSVRSGWRMRQAAVVSAFMCTCMIVACALIIRVGLSDQPAAGPRVADHAPPAKIGSPSNTPSDGDKAQASLGTTVGDKDRLAAQQVLSYGGSVTIRKNGKEQMCQPGSPLPESAFELVRVHFDNQPELTDSALGCLEGLPNLVEVFLVRCRKFTGSGILHLANLPRLEALWLDDSGVTNASLAHLAVVPGLRLLALPDTIVSDAGLVHLKSLPELRLLALGGSRVTDRGLANLETLSRLEALRLEGTGVTDAGLIHLRGLKSLRRLSLWSTQVTNAGLVNLQNLTRLEELLLGGVPVTDAGLASIESLTQLKHLWLDGTLITDAGLIRLQSLRQLEELNIESNPITIAGVDALKKSLPSCRIIANPATFKILAGPAGSSRATQAGKPTPAALTLRSGGKMPFPPTRLLRVNEFDDPRRGLISDIDAPADAKHGQSDGVYFISLGGFHAWNIHDIPADGTFQVVGRVLSENPSESGAWCVLGLSKTTARGFLIKINVKGELVLKPSPWPKAKAFRQIDPQVGPIMHSAIKPGKEFNKLLLIIRKRELLIFVNGVEVCAPVKFAYDLTPARLQLGSTDPGKKRAEFDRVEIREMVSPEEVPAKVELAPLVKVVEAKPAAATPKPKTAVRLNPPKLVLKSIGMKLNLIPGGDFLMGSPDDAKNAAASEKPRHPVRITPFYLGVTEVTQAQYRAVMGNNPSHFSDTGDGKDKVAGRSTDQFPVERVSWDDAVEFCDRLSEKDGRTPFYRKAAQKQERPDSGYRLPTEAEWEYACRAGTPTPYFFGNSAVALKAHAWSHGNAAGTTHPVGEMSPNAFGLYDMLGNVSEWCSDWFDGGYYLHAPAVNPAGPVVGTQRVYRGGNFRSNPPGLRSAVRASALPMNRRVGRGFRVVLGTRDP